MSKLRRILCSAFLVTALCAFAAMAALRWRSGADASRFVSPAAPHGMTSLALARSAMEFETIRKEWAAKQPAPPVCTEPANERDYVFAYVPTLALLSFAALSAAGAPAYVHVVVLAAIAGTGYADLEKTLVLSRLLGCPPSSFWDRWAVDGSAATARFTAQAAWIGWLGVWLTVVVVGCAAVRRAWLRRKPETRPRPPQAPEGFAALLHRETAAILKHRPQGREEIDFTASVDIGGTRSNEPWLQFRGRDVVGLALSGGGIRSATFNLGFLTGLSRLGRHGDLSMLNLFDYLSTVSGGGYVGSFWTAWMARPSVSKRPTWPPTPPSMTEAPAIRHLREFSGFLAPRWGFFEAETWQGLVAIVAGLIPSLAVAFSVLGLGLVTWLTTTFFLACPRPAAGALFALVLTWFFLWGLEVWWAPQRRFDAEEELKVNRWTYRAVMLGAILIVAAAQWGIASHYDHAGPYARPSEDSQQVPWLYAVGEQWRAIPTPPSEGPYRAWWLIVGIGARDVAPTGSWILSPRLFDLSLAWAIGALVLIVLRPFYWIFARGLDRPGLVKAAFDRVTMRLLGTALALAIIAVLWHLSINLDDIKEAAFGSVAAAGGFAALRNWIGLALRSGPETSMLDRVLTSVPQLLAYVAVGLAVVVTGYALIAWGGHDWLAWFYAVAAMALSVGLMLIFDPNEIGLHAFYRDRLTRAYCGASNPDPSPGGNRQTDVRKLDDVWLDHEGHAPPTGADLPPPRPLHLVCCTANDLAGDQIETLARGGRSAVLSRYGIAVGPRWVAPESPITLGSAITASAAAFNSNMGSVSMMVGPLVSFLMSALNLRLGLWVQNPLRDDRTTTPLLPGVRFFDELVGRTTADAFAPALHLSDGGHFENLAVYELIRRHCRYIIVCDCGEDADVAFVDFGNAARRIREDFGVEIDVDLSPLHPKEARRSEQHVVVGTIHYSEFDKGVLVYVKPTLTGDEPPDVLQYSIANEKFPHETTVDQFYDEAQWEAYRKLGEHTAGVAFGFVSRHPKGEWPSADWIFTSARQEWLATPPGLTDRVSRMTERFDELQADLGKLPDETMEAFPEIALLSPGARPKRAHVAPTPEAQVATLSACLRMVQFMEDTWTNCELDTAWNHRLNIGWVNLFARWASAPTFRMWWPLIAPLYSVGLRRFVAERFPGLGSSEVAPGTLRNAGTTLPSGLAQLWWTERNRPPRLYDLAGQPKSVCVYEIAVTKPGSADRIPVQVAIVLVSRGADARSVWWTSDDLFVPQSLWGAEFGRDFLRQLIDHLTREPQLRRCSVYVREPERTADPGSWDDRIRFVEFYKAAGFQIRPEISTLPDGQHVRAIELELIL